MNIFEFDCYKKFTNYYISRCKSNGRGELKRIASALNIHTTLSSQIFRGERELTPEQGHSLSIYLKLSVLETKYLLTLVNKVRAGNHKLSKFYQFELSELKISANKLSNRLKIKKKLTEKESSIFYSHSLYSHIRLLTSIPSLNKNSQIAKHLSISKNEIDDVIRFLLSTGLVVEQEGELQMGPAKTALAKDSPFVLNHHRNWRIKALNKQEKRDGDDMYITSPMTFSVSDFPKIKEEIRKCIDNIIEIVGPSNSEKLYCLNIDLFKES